MNDQEMDQIEAEARAEAYKPAVDRIAEAREQPRTDGVIVPADTMDPVNLWPALVHPTGNKVEELVYDPSTAGGPGDAGYPSTIDDLVSLYMEGDK